jgi:ABC-2 type transport system ATP-binding protein
LSAVVELQTISKHFGEKVAVDSISLSIEPGTMFGLLGPNGAGKTTSIRMITGITLPDTGAVHLFGQPFARHALRRVGYLPEERGLYRKMLVLGQLIFMGQMHGLSKADAEARARQWAARLEIADALTKKTDELSKGMQQKIQFISTLLHEPELIILDEPFSGLDPVNALLLEDTLLELKRSGRTILFSTHRMDQVEKLCDSIALVHNGKIVLEGAMRAVKRRYPRERVLVAGSFDEAMLSGHASVAEVKHFSGHSELQLAAGADPHALLRELVLAGAQLDRWDVQEPTLEEIFVRTVGGRVDA